MGWGCNLRINNGFFICVPVEELRWRLGFPETIP